jgi:NAD(P)-dependent dehydrogenase (short-subunit alcohol dehydrogenase family)
MDLCIFLQILTLGVTSQINVPIEIKPLLGRLDIVICNAAILYFAHTLDLKDEEIQKALNVNVLGTINASSYLRNKWKRNLFHSRQFALFCPILNPKRKATS